MNKLIHATLIRVQSTSIFALNGIKILLHVWKTNLFVVVHSCQIDMKLPVTSAFTPESKEILFLKGGIHWGKGILFLLSLGSCISWSQPPVSMIQTVKKVQPNVEEQVKLGSITHFTRCSMSNIPHRVRSHPFKLHTGYWSELCSHAYLCFSKWSYF